MSFQFWSVSQVSGQLSDTLSPNRAFELHEIRAHSSNPDFPTSTLVVQLDSTAGAAYDYKIINQSMSGETDYGEVFDPPMRFQSGDQIITSIGVAGAFPTHGLEIIYRHI